MSSEDNIKLFNLYYETKDVSYIHKIIENHNKIIYKTINDLVKKEDISNPNVAEYYSHVYFGIFKKLQKMNPTVANLPYKLYFYIRRWTIASLTLLFQKEKRAKNYRNDQLSKEAEYIDDNDILENMTLERKKELIRKYMDVLTPREKKVLYELYKFSPEAETTNLSIIGRKMNLSRERINQIRNSALSKIYNKIIENADNSDMLMMDKEQMKKYMPKLSEQEREVLDLFYAIENKDITLSLTEISERLDMDRVQIRTIKTKALQKIYQMAREDIIKSKSKQNRQ